MPKYNVGFRWWITLEVEADSEEEAEQLARDTVVTVDVACPDGTKVWDSYDEGSEACIDEAEE